MARARGQGMLSFRKPRSGYPESITTTGEITHRLWLWIPGSRLRRAPE
ncbi:MAG: hypothetical protein QOF14_148 [Hyphomicrobiales bacterium]|jgi:hypothetical protein|nr:hypothetical protein [Hyphomicrobiales bacterium]